ncbi:alanine--tRNA ligase [Candidatus Acetothermia bacterium]|nr:alanine--tRNA ligase [Candidatus Acetothermia bacterium]
MKASQLRRLFLDFFVAHGHKVLPSSSIVPDDPTLLFTSAGMVQFKEIFQGERQPLFPRVATCQKCFRATDIEKVGKTTYHHTFFEMLGNFSFGDYFKEEAIALAWKFLTHELGISPENLWVSVYEEDNEAYSIWQDSIGIPSAKIIRSGKEDNWWGPVGGSGPCGPDTEIFYDFGVEKACGPECSGINCDCARFLEIWNLVFIQYDAQPDGRLLPLKQTGIDTGMGLERTAALLQGVASDFEIDIFRPLIEQIETVYSGKIEGEQIVPRNLIADHIRAIVFLIAAGVVPASDKQGYVLRRILRRTVRAGEMLHLAPGVLSQFVDPVVETMSKTYPEIELRCTLAKRIITIEESTFRRTLLAGERMLEEIIPALLAQNKKIIPGKQVFELYDTYGFPIEMTQEIAAAANIEIDQRGFEMEMVRQKNRSRSVKRESVSAREIDPIHKNESLFYGYTADTVESEILQIIPSQREDSPPSLMLRTGEEGIILVRQTPFYAESGGQIADTGEIENKTRHGKGQVFDVQQDTYGRFLHRVKVIQGEFSSQDQCLLKIDRERRRSIERNHTATHLLHTALRQILGEHVVQSGSLVTQEELRFDFNHFEPVTPAELVAVENLANSIVLADIEVETMEMSLPAARALGVIAHFAEEYEGKELVRVVRVGRFSAELCGGTHVRRSGEIGLIKILSEASVAAGTRRIHAVTGEGILRWLRSETDILTQLRSELGKDPGQGLSRLLEEKEQLQAQVIRLTQDLLCEKRAAFLRQGEKIDNVMLFAGRLDMGIDELKMMVDILTAEAPHSVALLIGNNGDRAVAVCKVTANINEVVAGKVVKEIAALLGGGGGGSRTFAQGGGPDVNKIDAALKKGSAMIRASIEAS